MSVLLVENHSDIKKCLLNECSLKYQIATVYLNFHHVEKRISFLIMEYKRPHILKFLLYLIEYCI